MRTLFACSLLLALVPRLGAAAPLAPVPAGALAHRSAASPLPLDRISPGNRSIVAELIAHPTIYHRSIPRVFPADHRLYQTLIDRPVLTLALWRELGQTGVHLVQDGPFRYRGDDGMGSSAVWEFVYQSPTLHAILGRTAYQGPLFNHRRIETTTLLVLRTGYYREVNARPYIEHQLETYIRVETAGWRALARTFSSMADRMLEDKMQDALVLLSLMCQLVEESPSWAAQTVVKAPGITESDRRRFLRLVSGLPGRPPAALGRK